MNAWEEFEVGKSVYVLGAPGALMDFWWFSKFGDELVWEFPHGFRNGFLHGFGIISRWADVNFE